MKYTKTPPFYVPKNFALVIVLPSSPVSSIFCFLLRVLFPTIPMASVDLKATSVVHITINKSILHDSIWHSLSTPPQIFSSLGFQYLRGSPGLSSSP